MTNPEKYLLEEADGLPTRPSQDYVHYKLKALSTYLSITNNAMKDRPWRERFFLDLQAGPGKNNVNSSILFGSPLIAFIAPNPSTQFRFNELSSINNDALKQRIAVSPLKDSIKIYQEDVNLVVDRIVEEITAIDKRFIQGKWPSLNVAFLDPEGLELHWATVEKLASISKMDLIINFSTMGIVRLIGDKNFEPVNRYFGIDKWKDVDIPANPVQRRRAFIDFYRMRLEKFDYNIDIDPSFGGDDIAVNNSKNAQVYSLIFASKNPLGDKFWKQAAKSSKPPRLPGFG